MVSKEERQIAKYSLIGKKMELENQRRLHIYISCLGIYVMCMFSIILMPDYLKGILAFTFTGMYIGSFVWEIFNGLKARWDYEDAKEESRKGRA